MIEQDDFTELTAEAKPPKARSRAKSKPVQPSDERIAIMMRVLDGELPADCLTMDDVRYLQERVMDAIIDKEAQRGDKIVLDGFETPKVH